MKKEIYTLLNEIDNHTDTYETSPVQKEELKNWKQAFAKRMQSEQAESRLSPASLWHPIPNLQAGAFIPGNAARQRRQPLYSS